MNTRLRKTGLAVAMVAVLGAAAFAATPCSAQPATGRAGAQSVDDTIGELEQTPARVISVTLKVQPGTAGQVAAAAKNAGANSVNPLFDTNSVVITGTAAHVRAAVDTGHVLRIQRGTPGN